MTDTNMTDTNTFAVVMVVCHRLWKTHACVDNTKGMVKDRRRAAVVGGVCGFVVCCAVSGTTPVVLGVLVVIVAGSRPVVLFEPGC